MALVGAFTGWVPDSTAPGRPASVRPARRRRPGQVQGKVCTARRMAGTYGLTARYWDKEPQAALYTTILPGPGLVRSRSRPHHPHLDHPGAPVPREHCEISGGSLAGLQALVAKPSNGPLEVFTTRYMQLDSASPPGYRRR